MLIACLLRWNPDANDLAAVITDPDDPRFDLEKLFAKWESEA